ncbi:unnamed protein product [Orchesella dallaii]|uniref:C2H2-type domain-containing protein n=1 Tax=Orchesella dallaii TaxID=48710 RepID=A0ABP1RPN4_9HEXA
MAYLFPITLASQPCRVLIRKTVVIIAFIIQAISRGLIQAISRGLISASDLEHCIFHSYARYFPQKRYSSLRYSQRLRDYMEGELLEKGESLIWCFMRSAVIVNERRYGLKLPVKLSTGTMKGGAVTQEGFVKCEFCKNLFMSSFMDQHIKKNPPQVSEICFVVVKRNAELKLGTMAKLHLCCIPLLPMISMVAFLDIQVNHEAPIWDAATLVSPAAFDAGTSSGILNVLGQPPPTSAARRILEVLECGHVYHEVCADKYFKRPKSAG